MCVQCVTFVPLCPLRSGSPPSGVNRAGGVQDRGHGDIGTDNVTASSSESSSTATPARKRSEIRPDQGAARLVFSSSS